MTDFIELEEVRQAIRAYLWGYWHGSQISVMDAPTAQMFRKTRINRMFANSVALGLQGVNIQGRLVVELDELIREVIKEEWGIDT